MDDHGIHKVALDYCGCGHAQTHTTQILQHGWYPAMVDHPKTTDMICILEQFHLLTFESKASAYEFYYSLVCETNNMAIYLVKDQYMAWLRMVCQWQHLTMLKKAACKHNPLRVTLPLWGSVWLHALVCPQPGKNLPPNWKSAPEDQRFINLTLNIFILLHAI